MENFLTLHGANPENLYKIFNIEMPAKILDFSTNVNIFSWPDVNINLQQNPSASLCSASPLIRGDMKNKYFAPPIKGERAGLPARGFDYIKKLVSNYPDLECSKLRELISERENISKEKILFTNGTNEAIFLVANLLREKKGKTGIFQPCYSEYKRAFRNAQDVFDIGEAKNFKNFIIVNPNNPTGIFIKNLSDFVKKFSETLFIIDEAYIDFLLNYEREKFFNFENVILLRSLTKIFHLSGARIGYVIANEKIISELKNLQPSWSVNTLAQELAFYFLNDRNFYENSRAFYKKNTPKFMNTLKKLNFEVMNSDVNFFLIKVKNDIEVIKFLLNSGIVVRHTRNFSGINGKYIRVATLKPNENNFFIETLTRARNLHQDFF